MTRAAVASVIFGFFIFILGLFPAIINLDTKPGVGVLQLAVTLWGLGMVNAGAALWAYSERHRGAPRLLREDIGVRLIATGFVISAFSSLADVLGIGSPQIVAGWRAMNPRGEPGIRLYVPGDAAGVGAQRFEIGGTEVAVEDLKLADLDGDGRLDIIAAGRQTKNVRIFWNLGTAK